MDSEDVAGEKGGSSLCQSRGDGSPRVSRKLEGEEIAEYTMIGLNVNLVCSGMLIAGGQPGQVEHRDW